jgi:hypothetical protein
MTELTHPLSPSAPRSQRRGFIWFAAMIGGWIAFFALMLLWEATLGDLSERVRNLPLVVEALVWLALFPYVLSLTIWDSSWDEWLRSGVVALCAVGWSFAFYPWRRARNGPDH